MIIDMTPAEIEAVISSLAERENYHRGKYYLSHAVFLKGIRLKLEAASAAENPAMMRDALIALDDNAKAWFIKTNWEQRQEIDRLKAEIREKKL